MLWIIICLVVLAMYWITYLRIGDIANHGKQLVKLAEDEREERGLMLLALRKIADQNEGGAAPGPLGETAGGGSGLRSGDRRGPQERTEVEKGGRWMVDSGRKDKTRSRIAALLLIVAAFAAGGLLSAVLRRCGF